MSDITTATKPSNQEEVSSALICAIRHRPMTTQMVADLSVLDHVGLDYAEQFLSELQDTIEHVRSLRSS